MRLNHVRSCQLQSNMRQGVERPEHTHIVKVGTLEIVFISHDSFIVTTRALRYLPCNIYMLSTGLKISE